MSAGASRTLREVPGPCRGRAINPVGGPRMSITIFPRAARAALLAALLACAVALYAAASADASFKAGVYKGKTAQGAKVSLKVISSKKAVIKFSWAFAQLGCSDGQQRTLEGETSPSSVKFALSRTGKFGFTADNDAGTLSFGAQGKIKNSKATGAIQVQAKINESNELDPNGAIFCDSDFVTWTAKR